MRRRRIRGYQALVLGYRHPNGYNWPLMIPLTSALTRKEARRGLRAHLGHSVTPFTIRLLWKIGGKMRGWGRRKRQGWPSKHRTKIDRLRQRAGS